MTKETTNIQGKFKKNNELPENYYELNAEEQKKIIEKILEERKKQNLTQANTILYWAENLCKAIPYYYDKNNLWWIYNFEENKYEITDETDILNALRLTSNVGEMTINKKSQLVEALKQIGREYSPKELGKEWIQFKNEIHNIETNQKKEATPEYLTTNPIPHPIGENEETPEIDKLFTEWVGEQYKQTLYEIIAYCCLSDYPLHRFFILTGSGLNGKGKFLEILEKFIGESNATNIDLDAITDGNNRFEKANLYKKLVCLVGETNYGQIKKTGMLKSLTGGDLITFEFKNKNPFQARNYAKIIMATNSLPPTTDRTTGFYRRPLIIDFPNTFKEDPKLLERIPEKEYSNLAKKCLRILKNLLENKKFHNEGTIEERMQKYEDVSNPLQRFLREKTVQDMNGHIFKFDFKDRFISWQQQNGYRVWNETMIGKMMKEQFDDSKKANDDKSNYWYAWVGLSWKKKKNFQGFQGFYPFPLSSYTRKAELKVVETLETLENQQSISLNPFIQAIGNINQGGLFPLEFLIKKTGFDEKTCLEGLKKLCESGDVMQHKPNLWLKL